MEHDCSFKATLSVNTTITENKENKIIPTKSSHEQKYVGRLYVKPKGWVC